MDFVWAALRVILGGFVLFTVARIAYAFLVPRAGWMWVAFVAGLALVNMLAYQWAGRSINPPLFTSALFAVTLIGMAPDSTVVEDHVSDGSRWFKRGVYGVAIGTAIGWLAFAEVASATL